MFVPDHEKLDVYHRAVRAAALVEKVALAVPEARADLRDQMRRASTSVVLNIAEGANGFAPRDKARYYRIAQGSAGECLAALDLARQVGPGSADDGAARSELLHVMGSLRKMVFAMQRRK
ncbi:MAG TPA: four helix bundle protein [Candidatus Thermoplasmatota archaeon]|nr:four helix bundle protein [Candidatus Thermoplasmatota archaeon]